MEALVEGGLTQVDDEFCDWATASVATNTRTALPSPARWPARRGRRIEQLIVRRKLPVRDAAGGGVLVLGSS